MVIIDTRLYTNATTYFFIMSKIVYLTLIVSFFAGLSSNDIECQLCIDIVSAIEDFITDGATQDDIIQWAEQVILCFTKGL